jgi:ATP-binding cassette subfamily B protein
MSELRTPGRGKRLSRLAAVMFFDGFRAAPGWMALVTCLLVVGSIASTCYPLGYRVLVDGTLAGSGRQVTEGVLLVAGLMSLGWVLIAIGATESMALSDRIATYRNRQLINLISGVPGMEHLERPDYLTEIERINSNRRQLAAAPRQLLSNVSNLARIVTLLLLLGSVTPWLLLLPLAAVPPVLADRLSQKLTRRAENDIAHTRRLAGMLFGLASDVATAGELRAYGLSGHLSAEHARLSAQVNRRSTRQAVQVLAVQSAGWLLYAAALIGAMAFVVIRAVHGELSLGSVLMAVSLIRRSRNQLVAAASGSGALVSTLTTIDRLFWLQDHAAEAAAKYGSQPAPSSLSTGIVLRNITFHYPGTETPVLRGLDLTFPAGSTVAVVGENGSGKTTLVKLLLGMYRPDAGEILVDDVPLQDIDPQAWRARTTAAFQDFSRFALPAVQSVGVAELASLDDEDAALAALQRAGAGELAAALPHGLATEVGTTFTGGHNLSGGQWQKLALGRAMRRLQPLLMVLDEPTASLDARAEHDLFEHYASAARQAAQEAGAITILISHRFSTVQAADLIVYLGSGRAIEIGSHEQLLAADGKYAELFNLQASGYR